MENNVTNEMRARIFAAYLGSNVLYKEKATTYTGVKGNTPWSKQVCLEISPNLWTYEYECKLLLYDLSDIAEEICIKLSELLYEAGGGDWFGEEDKGAIVDFCKMIVGQYESDDKEFFEAYDIEDFGNGKLNIAAIIDYLRSEKYDCGYSNIPSLITAGIAIKLKR